MLILSCFFVFACNQEKATNSETSPTENDKTVAQTPPQVAVYPDLPLEFAQNLYNNADKVDVLFSRIAISLSQVKESDVKYQLSLMQRGSVPKKINCTETANIIYQSQGDIIGDARMYLENGCRYVVFYVDNKPAYGAQMNDDGMSFYNRIIKSAANVPTE